MKNNIYTDKGFTLVEALVGMAIIAVVMVGILSAFSQQQMVSRKNFEKNIAMNLAEMKLEELSKFSSTQLDNWLSNDPDNGNVVEYIIRKDGKFESSDVDPGLPKQYRRTTIVYMDLLRQIATIRVTVEYGRAKKGLSSFVYPFQITLTTRRGK